MLFSLRKAITFTQDPLGGVPAGMPWSAVGHLWCYMKTGVTQDPTTGMVSWAPNDVTPLFPVMGVGASPPLDPATPQPALSISRQFAILGAGNCCQGQVGWQYGYQFASGLIGNDPTRYLDLIIHLMSPASSATQQVNTIAPGNPLVCGTVIGVIHLARTLLERGAFIGIRSIRWTIDTATPVALANIASFQSSWAAFIEDHNLEVPAGAINLYFIDLLKDALFSSYQGQADRVNGPFSELVKWWTQSYADVGRFDGAICSLFVPRHTDEHRGRLVAHELGHYLGAEHCSDTKSCADEPYDANVMRHNFKDLSLLFTDGTFVNAFPDTSNPNSAAVVLLSFYDSGTVGAMRQSDVLKSAGIEW